MNFICYVSLVLLVTTCSSKRVEAKSYSYTLKDITTSEGNIFTLASLNDSLYYLSQANLKSYSPLTGEHNAIGAIPGVSNQWSTSAILNGKIYVTSYSYNSLYQYDPIVGLSRVANIDGSPEGLIKLNDKVYMGTAQGAVYEFDPLSKQTKRISSTNINLGDLTGVAALKTNNKLYTCSYRNEGIYEVDPVTGFAQLIFRDSNIRVIVEINNKIYFSGSTNILRQYDPRTMHVTTLCIFPEPIEPKSIVEFNKEIYIGGTSSNFLWKYNGKSECEKIPVTLPGNVLALLALSNKLYIGCSDSHLHELEVGIQITELKEILAVRILNVINNNNDHVILNEISYLNPDVDIPYLTVSNKTKRSATIEGKGSYFGHVQIYFTLLEENSIESFDFMKLLKKGVFISYRNKNNGTNTKDIDVLTDKLFQSNVIVLKSNETTIAPTITKNAICFESLLLKNNQSQSVQTRTPICNYQKKIRLSTKIINGLKGIKIKDSSTAWKDLLGVWPFENVDSMICTENDIFVNDDSITLSSDWNTSIETNSCIITSDIIVESEVISIPPYRDVNISAMQEKNIQKVTLNLKQVMYGEVLADIVTIFNEDVKVSFSIKELMENLKQERMLPPQILINDDETVSVNAKLVRTLTRTANAVIEISEIGSF